MKELIAKLRFYVEDWFPYLFIICLCVTLLLSVRAAVYSINLQRSNVWLLECKKLFIENKHTFLECKKKDLR